MRPGWNNRRVTPHPHGLCRARTRERTRTPAPLDVDHGDYDDRPEGEALAIANIGISSGDRESDDPDEFSLADGRDPPDGTRNRLFDTVATVPCFGFPPAPLSEYVGITYQHGWDPT